MASAEILILPRWTEKKKLFEKCGQKSKEMCTKIADGLRAEQQLAYKVFFIWRYAPSPHMIILLVPGPRVLHLWYKKMNDENVPKRETLLYVFSTQMLACEYTLLL